MDINRLSDLRPRFVWDIVDVAFDLYRERFTLLFGVCAVLYIPSTLLTDLCTNLFERPIVDSTERFYAAFLLLFFVAVPLETFLTTIRMGVIAAIIDAQFRGKPIPTIRGAYQAAMRHWASLIGVAFLTSIFTVLALCFGLGIGAIYFSVAAAFIAPAVVLENRRPIGALKRSFALAGSDRGRVFGVMVLLTALTVTLSLGLSLMAAGGVSLIPQPDATAATREIQQHLTEQATGGIVGALFEPLLSIALILLYFDLRVRRQGIDLAAQAEEHGVALAPDPFGDTTSDRVVREQQRRRFGRRAKGSI